MGGSLLRFRHRTGALVRISTWQCLFFADQTPPKAAGCFWIGSAPRAKRSQTRPRQSFRCPGCTEGEIRSVDLDSCRTRGGPYFLPRPPNVCYKTPGAPGRGSGPWVAETLHSSGEWSTPSCVVRRGRLPWVSVAVVDWVTSAVACSTE